MSKTNCVNNHSKKSFHRVVSVRHASQKHANFRALALRILNDLSGTIRVTDRDFHQGFRADVFAGLAARPRAIPPRWFYDRCGSVLFEAITKLAEYYPSRTKRAILSAYAAEVSHLTGPGRVVLEFGSGSSAKTPLLLSAVSPAAYVPVDISGDFLRESAANLAKTFPGLPIYPVEGDFTCPLVLPRITGMSRRLGFFPGSTIGNMSAPAAADLLRSMKTTLGDDAMLLLGIDRIKDEDILLKAYDDPSGVTAEFNSISCAV